MQLEFTRVTFVTLATVVSIVDFDSFVIAAVGFGTR